jgi:hypothetical protein
MHYTIMIILRNKFKLLTATCKGAKRKKKIMMMVMTIKQLIEKRKVQNIETHLVLVDLEAAYDAAPTTSKIIWNIRNKYVV